jgi:hypothetical protein
MHASSTARRVAIALCLASSVILPASTQEKASLVGSWLGELKIQSQSLRIVVNITGEEGKLKATMDSPDQGAKGLPVSSIAIDGNSVTIESKPIGAIYMGKLSPDGKRMTGTWNQRGIALPLDLVWQKAPFALSRPQAPKAPFPYKAEDVTVENKKAGVRLAGTLLVPAGKGPFPAIVFVPGSGPQNRDEEILGHKPFLVLADYLARRGIASLRYDDRGVGGSTGDFAKATTSDFADDAEAAFGYLEHRQEAKKGSVGIVGHSEGGVIAPIVASRNRGVSFIVLLAGPGIKGEDLVLLQGRILARAQGMGDSNIAAAMKVNKELYDIVQEEGDEAVIAAKAKKAYLDYMKSTPEAKGVDDATLSAMADQTVRSLLSPWYRCFLSLDPVPYLAKVGAPVLALDGSKDLQVPAQEDLAGIKAAIGKSAGGGPNSKNKFMEIEGLNHLFQHAKTGSPDEYGKIEETFAPEAMQAVGDWILGL